MATQAFGALKSEDLLNPAIHLEKSSDIQNVGGGSGTVTYITWDSEILKDTGFTHSTSTNTERVTVADTGRYQLWVNIGITKGGADRTTFMSHVRANGTTSILRGRGRNYTRGTSWANAAVQHHTELDLTASDYIEIGITVEDSDGVYTNNTIDAECELILRRIR